MQWATQVITICIEMVVPIVLGVWADHRLGTKIVFTLLGVGAGLWLGIWSLVKLAKTFADDSDKPTPEKDDRDQST